MTNEQIISKILKENNIKEFAFLPFGLANKANGRLWDKCQKTANTCIIILFPYKTQYTVKDGYVFSAYARTRDYHSRATQFFDKVIPLLENATGGHFEGFADHSPIGEKYAAARCGLGCIGKNTLLINKRFGSFVFIASIITDLKLKSDETTISSCANCGKCMSLCPNGAITENGFDFKKCLSYISQKKTKTHEEWELLRKNNVIWGCDKCQDVCPMNSQISFSTDSYFESRVLDCVSKQLIENMNDDEFSEFPFSWRSKSVILENFDNLNKKQP